MVARWKCLLDRGRRDEGQEDMSIPVAFRVGASRFTLAKSVLPRLPEKGHKVTIKDRQYVVVDYDWNLGGDPDSLCHLQYVEITLKELR